MQKNESEKHEWDRHFAFKRSAEKEGSCPTFDVTSRHKWVLKLNESTTVTYFTVMFHPGGFFGGKMKRIYEESLLSKSAITADIGGQTCKLSSAWDYTYPTIGSMIA